MLSTSTAGSDTQRLPGRRLARAWLFGGLSYVLLILPAVADMEGRGPFARFLAPHPHSNVVVVMAADTVRRATPYAEPSKEVDTLPEVRFVELLMLVSIPALLIRATLRWLLWKPAPG
jgi:hypothetical protein